MPANSMFCCAAWCLMLGRKVLQRCSIHRLWRSQQWWKCTQTGEGKGGRGLLLQPVGCGWEAKGLLSDWERKWSMSLTAERGSGSPVLDKQNYRSWRLLLAGLLTTFGVQIILSKKTAFFFFFLLGMNLVKDNSLNPEWLHWELGLCWRATDFSLCRGKICTTWCTEL